ncbi:MAG: hypothetical protein ACXVCR_17845 [Bdellovibrio sp.]
MKALRTISKLRIAKICTFICAATGFLSASNVNAATIPAASCSSTDVSNAIATAVNGDTVSVPAGTCTWSPGPTLPMDKGIKLIGAGAGSTIINVSDTISLICNTGMPHRLSGFTFQNAPDIGVIRVMGACSGMRIDHNVFLNFSSSADAISWDSAAEAMGMVYGLVDHNTFTGSGNFRGVVIYGNMSSTWPSSPLGTPNATYIEDNIFNFTSMANPGAGCVDSNYASSYVFRNNNVKNCLVTAHGVGFGAGTISAEIYNNNLVVDDNSLWPSGYRMIHHQGSGEMMVFNNKFTASGVKSDTAISLTHYRSAPPDLAFGVGTTVTRCDGSQAMDGNRSPLTTYYGYPCFHQPGRNGNMDLSPIYIWNNVWSDTGSAVDLNVEDPWGSGTPSPFTHIQPERDYYNYVSSGFNGTSGTGSGLLANRPTTCTTNSLEAGGGVGYWATDTNKLYRCSAKNTWVVQYAPYTYPHPLVVGTVSVTLAAPTNLRVK